MQTEHNADAPTIPGIPTPTIQDISVDYLFDPTRLNAVSRRAFGLQDLSAEEHIQRLSRLSPCRRKALILAGLPVDWVAREMQLSASREALVLTIQALADYLLLDEK